MQITDFPPQPPAPGLWRIGPAAACASMSVRMFEAAVARGDIPVEIVRVGAYRFVRCTELAAWLRNPSLLGAPR